MTEKRFTSIYNEKAEMMQYVDNQKKEPNRWAIWNATETTMKLNELADENEQLKSELKNCRECLELNRESCARHMEENEQLKQTVKRLNSNIDELLSVNVEEDLLKENKQLKVYKNLFNEFQKQLTGVKKLSDLDHKDFEDLIELSKGHVFDDELGWIYLPIKDSDVE